MAVTYDIKTPPFAPSVERVACNASGTSVVVSSYLPQFWLSHDGGDTWSEIDVGDEDIAEWHDFALDNDGSTILAVPYLHEDKEAPWVYVSHNGGSSWTKRVVSDDIDQHYYPVRLAAVSADGTTMALGKSTVGYAQLLLSHNGGATWTEYTSPEHIEIPWDAFFSPGDIQIVTSPQRIIYDTMIISDDGSDWSIFYDMGPISVSWDASVGITGGGFGYYEEPYGYVPSYTVNGGGSWSELPLPVEIPPQAGEWEIGVSPIVSGDGQRLVLSYWFSDWVNEVYTSGAAMATIGEWDWEELDPPEYAAIFAASYGLSRVWFSDYSELYLMVSGDEPEPPDPPDDDPPVDTYPPDPEQWPDWTDPDDTDTESPTGPYSFTDPVTKRALNDPGIVSIALGTEYVSGSVETVPITKQYYSQGVLSNDDLYVTFEGESFIGKLDTALFYGGRYEEGGIPASTLFEEVLSEIPFPPEGRWGYVLGEEDCKTSTTRPLWLTEGYEYYHIDPALDEVMVHIPIPVVSHREALTMLASYCGAYLLHASDGSLHVRASLDAPTDYHMNLRQVYDRPEMAGGESIAQVRGKLHTYNVADDPELILGARVAAPDGAVTRFTLEHDACADGSLVLTDANLLGTPTYNTYSTTFECQPTEDVFVVELTGKRVTIGEASFVVDYPNATGEVKEFTNPIASDITRTRQMYDRYYRWATALSYTFTMRDDPAVEVGDRVFLDTRSEPDGIPVLVREIRRTFNGGTEAQYTVVEDVERM